jgi:hypothetical protein
MYCGYQVFIVLHVRLGYMHSKAPVAKYDIVAKHDNGNVRGSATYNLTRFHGCTGRILWLHRKNPMVAQEKSPERVLIHIMVSKIYNKYGIQNLRSPSIISW